MKQADLLQDYRTPALGADLTSVKCKGKWLPLGVSVDAITGMTLSIDKLSGEDAQTLKEWLEPIIEAVDAQVLVTDDADALKTAADETGVYHQVCKTMSDATRMPWSNNCNPALPMGSTRLWSKSESLSDKPR